MYLQMRDLEYFAVLAEQGHLGRAAEVLGLSQPALSKCLRRLESSMGTKLVRRTPRGVDLTAVGSALRARVQRLRLSLDDVLHEALDLSEGRAGRLRVGAGAGMGDQFLAAACSTFLVEAPKVALSLEIAPNAMLLPALRKGEYDLVVSGIRAGSPEDLAQEKLYDDEFAVYCSRNHRLASRTRITLSDLAQERWALSAPNDLSWNALHRAFEDAGLQPPRVAFLTTASGIRIGAVASSDLISFASRRVLQRVSRNFGVTPLQVKGFAWRRSVGVSYRKDSYISPAAHRLISILKSTAMEMARAV